MYKQHNDIDWLIANYLSFFETYGLDEQYLRDDYENIRKKRNGFYPVKDYLWSLFQQLLMEAAKQATSELKFYTYNRDIHLKMWQFRRVVEKSKANDILQIFLDAKIRVSEMELPFKCFVVPISDKCCPYCSSLHEKHFSVQEVLDNKYLASEKCTREWGCNCTYIMEPYIDSDGNYITNHK